MLRGGDMSEKVAKERRKAEENIKASDRQIVLEIHIVCLQDGTVSVVAPLGNMPATIDVLGTALKILAGEIHKQQAGSKKPDIVVVPNIPDMAGPNLAN